MPFTPHIKNNKATPIGKLFAIKCWGLGFASAIASLLCSSTSANAVESVILRYRDTQTVIPRASLKTFATEGKISKDLQVFFQEISLSPEATRHLLTGSIIPNSKHLKLDRTTKEFLAIQLHKLVGTPYGQEPTDALKTFVFSATENGEKSILKLVEQYPQQEVRVELSRLEQIHNDINRLSKQIQPLQGVVNEILNDSACNCEPIATGPARILPLANSPKQRVFARRLSPDLDAQVPDCLNGHSFTIAPTKSDTISQPKAIAKTKTLTISDPLIVASNKPLTSSATTKAKQIVFTYGPLDESLSIHELSVLAKTGELSRSLSAFLKLVKVKPGNLRTLLTQEITVNFRVVDRALNSIVGEYALFQVGQILHTGSHQANIQALRAALVQSASDNRISPIEFLENYPLQQVYVDGVKLSQLIRSVKRTGGVSGFATESIRQIKDFLVKLPTSATVDKCACKSE